MNAQEPFRKLFGEFSGAVLVHQGGYATCPRLTPQAEQATMFLDQPRWMGCEHVQPSIHPLLRNRQCEIHVNISALTIPPTISIALALVNLELH